MGAKSDQIGIISQEEIATLVTAVCATSWQVSQMGNKIKPIRVARGLTQEQLGDLVNTSKTQISRLENGSRKLSQEWLSRLAAVLDCTVGDVIGEPGWTTQRASARLADPQQAITFAPPAAGRGTVVRVQGDEFAVIPVYDVDASAGPGAIVGRETASRSILFRLDWLRSVTGADLNRLAVLGVDGDSMEPTLRPGDTVLVDTGVQRPRDDGIYVVRFDGTLLVKRLRIDPARRLVTILSDNPAYPPIDAVAPNEITIAGRVIWIGRRV